MSLKVRRFYIIFTCAVMVSLGMAGMVSAQPAVTGRNSAAPAQATAAATATPIDPGEAVALTLGKAFTSPLDKDQVSYRKFTFNGTANQVANVIVTRLTGNLAFKVTVRSQGDIELGYAEGAFLNTAVLTIKLPQDGNYNVKVESDDPGAGDFQAGSFSILVAPVSTAAATAAPTKTQ